MMRTLVAVAALIFAQTAGAQAGLPVVQNYPDRPADLLFADGTRFHTTIYKAKVYGALPAQRKSPFLIISGYGCIDCDAEVSLYIVSVSDGPMRPEATQPAYAFPGKVAGLDSEALAFESRTWFGACVDANATIVWRQRTRLNDGTWRASLYMVSVGGDDRLVERESDDSPAAAAAIASGVTAGLCREIPPQNRSSSP